MRKIERLNKVCSILNNYIAEHKGVLEVKDVKELQAVQGRLGQFSSKTISADDAITAARARRVDSFERLQRAVTECKKQIEIVAVREGKNVMVPTVSKSLFYPSRIEGLAEKYLKAAITAGDDPAVKKAATLVQKAIEEYATASGDTTENVFNTRTFKKGTEFELDEINTKLNGFASYIAGHVSPADRAELYSRLVRARPASVHHAKTVTTPPVTVSSTQPVAIPTVPAGVNVPQTGEHAQLSATA